ncbi:MAG: EamA family transporter [Spirochaetales bacterium]|nr:EamA family transporter [Spirochaetales bacterium]
MTNLSNNIKTHLLLVLATIFWGVTPAFMKVSLLEMNAFTFSTLRLFTALIVSGLLLVFSRSWKKVEKKDWLLFVVIGLFGFFIFQISFPVGVKYTSASISSLIMATLPVNVVLINLLLRSEKISLRTITGIILSIAGITVIILGTKGGISLEGTYTIGVILLIISEVGFAVYTVKSKSLISKYSLYQVMFLVILFSFVPFVFISAKNIISTPFYSVSGIAWTGLIFTGIFGTCIANILWYGGIRHLGSTKTSIYANLPPVFGIIVSFIFLNETLTLLQIAGGFVIMAGVILVNRKNS